MYKTGIKAINTTSQYAKTCKNCPRESYGYKKMKERRRGRRTKREKKQKKKQKKNR